ncbi:MAG: hypothetical protein FWH50_00980 [Coriobacteriia bacterium]|nr:hypothetical protein [Coriobacteriia bacterium]
MFKTLVKRSRDSLYRLYAGWSLNLTEALNNQQGQGTTEYAILVGVLVVIAIVAIIAFRSKLEELWTSISDAVNGL